MQIPRSTSTRFPKYKFSEIQVFYGQVRTRTLFKRRKCYSPTSRQARVLVIQASIAVYLQDLPSRFFFLQFAQREIAKNSYRRATYGGNFSRALNQEFLFFGSRVAVFTSNTSRLKYWLLHHFFYKEAMCKGSTRNGLLYAAKAVPSKDYFTHLTLTITRKGH